MFVSVVDCKTHIVASVQSAVSEYLTVMELYTNSAVMAMWLNASKSG